MKADSRSVALEVLLRVNAGAFSDAALSRQLELDQLDRRDSALATLLVYGSLAWRLALDHEIQTLSDRKLSAIDAPVLEAIRLGLFQLRYLDRVPEWAAVNSSVDLARRHQRRAAGMVNAVLRRAIRQGPPALPDAARVGATERLSLEYSHPQWLVQAWLDQLGEDETVALLAANNTAAPTVLRCLLPREQALAELTARGVEATAAHYAPDALLALNTGDWSGVAVSQGEASQLVVLYLDPRPGQRVLDACAAPGGKTAYAASLAGQGPGGENGHVIAVDPARGARSRVASTLEASGQDNVEFHACSLQQLDTDDDFDAVLVDAPCSGLGTLRQNPEIRWRRQPSDLADLASRQGELLQLAAERVAPGGVLVYSTCTLVDAENDAVVDRFLAENDDFTEPVANDEAAACLQPLLDARGRLRTFPHLHGCDGFFAARLRRR